MHNIPTNYLQSQLTPNDCFVLVNNVFTGMFNLDNRVLVEINVIYFSEQGSVYLNIKEHFLPLSKSLKSTINVSQIAILNYTSVEDCKY